MEKERRPSLVIILSCWPSINCNAVFFINGIISVNRVRVGVRLGGADHRVTNDFSSLGGAAASVSNWHIITTVHGGVCLSVIPPYCQWFPLWGWEWPVT